MEMILLKKSRLIILLFIIPFALSGQQDPMYSMYMFSPMSINPAYAGTTEQIQAVGVFRRQWLNFPGSPQTAICSFHGPLKKENMGLGFSLVNDRLGEMQTTGFNAAYAYRVKLSKSTLSFGLQAGIRNFNIKLSEVQLAPVNQYDAAFTNNSSSWNANVGFGVFWYSEKWYAGLSMPHLRNHLLSDQQINTNDVARLKTHYNLYGGYVFKLNDEFKIKPSLLIKEVAGAPLQVDINTNVYWKNSYGLGLSYRTGSALVLLAEVKATNNLRIGYAFDIQINKLAKSVGSTHELMLRYDFLVNKNRSFTERDF